jgi:purine-nucleoside phosphorylase
MLKDLTRDDWLSILNIPESRIPAALILRGTRNLRLHYQSFQQYFTNILEVGTPNSVLEDVFIGDLHGCPVAYASVYGAPMTSEVVHVLGTLGTPLVIQTGCCGALADEIATGDLFAATEAFCGEGAAQYYEPEEKTIAASLDIQEWIAAKQPDDVELHAGRIYTTSALFAEGMEEVNAWFQAGFAAVDMETATTFAVAKYFNMERASLLFVFDNPRQKEHILLSDAQKDHRRAVGNERMIELVLELVRARAQIARSTLA